MITWLKQKIQEKIRHEAAKPRCGVSPFQLPRGFPLNGCCARHDEDYVLLRETALAEAKNYGIDLSKNHTWLERYRRRIETADHEFEHCLEQTAESWWQRLSAKLFMSIVKRSGWKVWIEGTIEAQSDIHNPYRFP
jgi:hypothetical protein